MNALVIIILYLLVLLLLGWGSSRLFRGTSKDFFVASHSIGPFLLLMSVFGTTMTAFALVGSTGKSFERGIGTYGLMASISGLIHMAIFFLIGIRLWALGKRWIPYSDTVLFVSVLRVPELDTYYFPSWYYWLFLIY